MRLIDADALIEAMKKTEAEHEKAMTCPSWWSAFNVISEQPSAYSVDKVIDELESFAKLAEDRWTNCTSKHAYQEYKCWVKAIEIVKKGGVSDDVCEWKLEDDNLMTGCGDYFNLYDNCTDKFKFCPTCGKKIKEVD